MSNNNNSQSYTIHNLIIAACIVAIGILFWQSYIDKPSNRDTKIVQKSTPLFDGKLVSGKILIGATGNHRNGLILIDYDDSGVSGGNVSHYAPSVIYNVNDCDDSLKNSGRSNIGMEVEFVIHNDGNILAAKQINPRNNVTENAFVKNDFEVASNGMNLYHFYDYMSNGSHRFGHVKAIDETVLNHMNTTGEMTDYFKATRLTINGIVEFPSLYVPRLYGSNGVPSKDMDYFLAYDGTTITIDGETLPYVQQIAIDHPPHFYD